MLLIAIAVPLVMVLLGVASIWLLLSSIVIVIFVPIILESLRSQLEPMKTGVILNDLLARTARVKLVYAIVFAVGMNL